MSRAAHFPTLFIIITGFSNAQFARQSVRLRVFDYITKPIDNDEIVKVVREAIDALQQSANVPRRGDGDPVSEALSNVYCKAGSYSKLTSDVIRYINESYSQPTISLKETAAKFSFPPPISRLISRRGPASGSSRFDHGAPVPGKKAPCVIARFHRSGRLSGRVQGLQLLFQVFKSTTAMRPAA